MISTSFRIKERKSGGETTLPRQPDNSAEGYEGISDNEVRDNRDGLFCCDSTVVEANATTTTVPGEGVGVRSSRLAKNVRHDSLVLLAAVTVAGLGGLFAWLVVTRTRSGDDAYHRPGTYNDGTAYTLPHNVSVIECYDDSELVICDFVDGSTCARWHPGEDWHCHTPGQRRRSLSRATGSTRTRNKKNGLDIDISVRNN